MSERSLASRKGKGNSDKHRRKDSDGADSRFGGNIKEPKDSSTKRVRSICADNNSNSNIFRTSLLLAGSFHRGL